MCLASVCTVYNQESQYLLVGSATTTYGCSNTNYFYSNAKKYKKEEKRRDNLTSDSLIEKY